MNGVPWKSQFANGRVFELKSKSARYPAPCALIINAEARGRDRCVVSVDRSGVIGDGLYRRSSNPSIYVDGLQFGELPKRIARRRYDLERFDYEDLALIQYGLAVDFDGCIHGSYSDQSIPTVIPAEWTVFWLAAWGEGDYRWLCVDHGEQRRVFRGAWYFDSHGGCRHLGYKFGRAWATRHTGARLRQIRQFLKSHFAGLIEQQVKVVRWSDGENTYTEELRRECPALGGRCRMIEYPSGSRGFYS